jgi:hypothetical protein
LIIQKSPESRDTSITRQTAGLAIPGGVMFGVAESAKTCDLPSLYPVGTALSLILAAERSGRTPARDRIGAERENNKYLVKLYESIARFE